MVYPTFSPPPLDPKGTLSSPVLDCGHSSRGSGEHQTWSSFVEITEVIGWRDQLSPQRIHTQTDIWAHIHSRAHTWTHSHTDKRTPPVTAVILSPLPRRQADTLNLPLPVILCGREVQPKVLEGQPGRRNTHTQIYTNTHSVAAKILTTRTLSTHSPWLSPNIPPGRTLADTQYCVLVMKNVQHSNVGKYSGSLHFVPFICATLVSSSSSDRRGWLNNKWNRKGARAKEWMDDSQFTFRYSDKILSDAHHSNTRAIPLFSRFQSFEFEPA